MTNPNVYCVIPNSNLCLTIHVCNFCTIPMFTLLHLFWIAYYNSYCSMQQSFITHQDLIKLFFHSPGFFMPTYMHLLSMNGQHASFIPLNALITRLWRHGDSIILINIHVCYMLDCDVMGTAEYVIMLYMIHVGLWRHGRQHNIDCRWYMLLVGLWRHGDIRICNNVVYDTRWIVTVMETAEVLNYVYICYMLDCDVMEPTEYWMMFIYVTCWIVTSWRQQSIELCLYMLHVGLWRHGANRILNDVYICYVLDCDVMEANRILNDVYICYVLDCDVMEPTEYWMMFIMLRVGIVTSWSQQNIKWCLYMLRVGLMVLLFVYRWFGIMSSSLLHTVHTAC